MRHSIHTSARKTSPSGGALLLWLVLVVGGAGDTSADESERARQLRAEGQIRPLTEIVEDARNRFSGRVLEAELEREDGRWIYELEVFTDEGVVVELYYDAETGAPLRTIGED